MRLLNYALLTLPGSSAWKLPGNNREGFAVTPLRLTKGSPMATFTLSRTFAQRYDAVVSRLSEEVADIGSGVLTEIALAATLKSKLDVEIPAQVILGACRPQLAEQAIQADPRIAAMLLCNVVIADEGESTRVEIFDPEFMTSFSDAPQLAPVTRDAKERLERMLAALDGAGSNSHLDSEG